MRNPHSQANVPKVQVPLWLMIILVGQCCVVLLSALGTALTWGVWITDRVKRHDLILEFKLAPLAPKVSIVPELARARWAYPLLFPVPDLTHKEKARERNPR